MSFPKRHHYLPECYLDFFASAGCVAVFDRETNTIRVQKVKDTAVVSHLYSVTRADGSKDPTLEKLLSKTEAAIPVLRRKLLEREILTVEDRSELAFHAALMMVRVPEFRESVARVASKLTKRVTQSMYQSEDDLRRSVEDWRREVSDVPEVDIPAAFNFLQGGAYDMRIDEDYALAMSFKLLPEFAKILFSSDTIILHSKTDAFVTSDRPFTPMADLRRPSGSGLLSPGCKKYLPFGSDLVIVFCGQGGTFSHADAPRNVVKGINVAVALMAYRFLIGKVVAQVDWLGQRILSKTESILGMDVF